MKRTLTILASSLSLASVASPAIAQDAAEPTSDQLTDMGETLASMFTSEPLTEEQEVRIPAASALIDMMMPEGFYAKMMEDAMSGTLEPVMSMFSGPELVLGSRIVSSEVDLDSLSQDERVELANLLDPASSQRGSVMQDIMSDMMRQVGAAIEPSFREGMTKAYAVRFDAGQLEDIAAFFATPTGQVYATESMMLMTDPQVMSASMQAMPQMMEQFGDLETQMKEAMASLPEERNVSDLSEAEQARAAELLGVETEALGNVVKPAKTSEE